MATLSPSAAAALKLAVDRLAARAKHRQLLAAWRSQVPPSFIPHFDPVSGRTRRATLSARQVALLRKQTLLAGREWPFDPPRLQRQPVLLKGHVFENRKIERLKKIEENMKNMPKKVEEYRKAMRARRPRRDDFMWLLNNI